jgi:hypothetical protein
VAAAGAYRLEELGWLQFQELCAAVVEADTGVPDAQFDDPARPKSTHAPSVSSVLPDL